VIYACHSKRPVGRPRRYVDNVKGCESGRLLVAQNRVDVLKISGPRISGVIVSRGQG
jgi:hypothetical protein